MANESTPRIHYHVTLELLGPSNKREVLLVAYVERLMSTHWALCLIHLLYAAFTTISAWIQRLDRRQPKPLRAQRSKLPKHLCLNLVASNDMPVEGTETAFFECLKSVAAWCRELGIETLTVYDRYGVLQGRSENVHRHILAVNESSEDTGESEVEYPLTPPLSESSGSRSHSPELAMPPADLNMITMMHFSRLRKRRNVAVRRQWKSKGASTIPSNLTLHITSRASGKPAVVAASRSLLQSLVSGASMSGVMTPSRHPYKLTVSKLAMILEGGFPPPDLMIIHHLGGMTTPCPPIELHGFPPWQNTLTEFHRTHPDDSPKIDLSSSEALGISETAFCRALDEYSGAEFRLGR